MKGLILLVTIVSFISIPLLGKTDEKTPYLPTMAEAKITNAKVDVEVTVDSRGIYKYVFSVTSLTITKGKIDGILVDLSVPQGGELISSTGLPNGIGTLIDQHDTAPEGNVVPVTFLQPPGWNGEYAIPPEEFISILGHRGSAHWFQKKDKLLSSGEQVRGLTLYSYGLPGIRTFDLDSFFIPVEGRDFPKTWTADKVRDWIMTETTKINFTGETIGPYAPPANFVPIDFLNYIVSLKQQSYQLGWIVQKTEDEHDKDKSKDKSKKDKDDKDKETGIMQSLDKKLNHAMTELQTGKTKQAVNILYAFMGEVEGLYNVCREHEEHDGDRDNHDKDSKDKGKNYDSEIASPPKADRNDKVYDHCDKSHLTSEAYALLKYNTEYLINRLGGTTKEHEKEDHHGSKDKDKDNDKH